MNGLGPGYWLFMTVLFAGLGVLQSGDEWNRFNLLGALICLATHSILSSGRR